MEHGLSSFVNFSYYPVNHVDGATGAFVCQSVDNGTVTDLDCEGTRYDSCLVDVYGGGGVAKQQTGAIRKAVCATFAGERRGGSALDCGSHHSLQLLSSS